MGRGRQNWRAFRPVMHLHKNHYIKRAGEAGIALRAERTFIFLLCCRVLSLCLMNKTVRMIHCIGSEEVCQVSVGGGNCYTRR